MFHLPPPPQDRHAMGRSLLDQVYYMPRLFSWKAYTNNGDSDDDEDDGDDNDDDDDDGMIGELFISWQKI